MEFKDLSPVDALRVGMAMCGISSSCMQPVAGARLYIAIYPKYVFPFNDARELPKMLKEVGLKVTPFAEPDEDVSVCFWNGTVEWFEGQPPMLVYYDPPFSEDLTQADFDRIREMGHFTYYSDPDKEKLYAWLREHGIIE